MEEEKIKTEADFQIERLKMLKEEKEKKQREMKIDAINLPEVKTKSKKEKNPYMVILDKDVYEKLHKKLVKLNKDKLKGKITKKKFVNEILRIILDLDIDLNEIKNILNTSDNK